MQKSIIVTLIGNEIKHTKNKTIIALHCTSLYHVIIHEYNVTNANTLSLYGEKNADY